MNHKSNACFFNILENKTTGGETASFATTFYLDNRELFVKVGAGFPRPKTESTEQ